MWKYSISIGRLCQLGTYLYKRCTYYVYNVNHLVKKVWLRNTMKLPTFIKIKITSGYYCNRITWLQCYNMQSNWRGHSKAAICKYQFIHYPSYTCATIHRSTLYLYNLLLLQQNLSRELKSTSGIPWRNSIIPHFTNGHE